MQKHVNLIKSCRSRQELSSAYFVAKFGFDTEENEPRKVCDVGACRVSCSQNFLCCETLLKGSTRFVIAKAVMSNELETAASETEYDVEEMYTNLWD